MESLATNNTDPSAQSTALKPNVDQVPFGFVRSDYGVLLRKNWLDATFHFCAKGAYDTLLVDYLARQSDPFVFVDVGANQGLYTILAGQNPHCQQVVAFEPVAATFALLQSNIEANRVAHVVSSIKAAVSLETGHTTIHKKWGHSGAATMRRLPGWFRVSETIATLGPASLRTRIPTDATLIIKVDVEGHEQMVFEALSKAGVLIQTQALFYEVNSRWSQVGVLEEILRAQGFGYFTATAGKRSRDVLATKSPVLKSN